MVVVAIDAALFLALLGVALTGLGRWAHRPGALGVIVT